MLRLAVQQRLPAYGGLWLQVNLMPLVPPNGGDVTVLRAGCWVERLGSWKSGRRLARDEILSRKLCGLGIKMIGLKNIREFSLNYYIHGQFRQNTLHHFIFIWSSFCSLENSSCHTSSSSIIKNIFSYLKDSFGQWGCDFFNTLLALFLLKIEESFSYSLLYLTPVDGDYGVYSMLFHCGGT